ncbi:Tuberous sclerosis 2-like protein [Myotisia sp. PD_48]|nr:Tuberous sclerosis 2-like protein [Myotisia sp. PD_48]
MSSDDVQPVLSQYKSSSSSLADVFKTFASGRPKSQSSPVLLAPGTPATLSPAEMEGRRGSRVTFGFESLHRGSVANNSSETPAPPSFDSVIHTISDDQPLQGAIEEADKASRSLYGFSGEQVLAIWHAGSYLVDHPSSIEARKAGAALLECAANRQDLSLSARQTLFNSISQPSVPDVIPSRVKALITLSDYGRKLDFTEEHEPVLRVIASWIVPLYEVTAILRSKIKRAKGQKTSNGFTFSETVLGELLQLIVDIVTLQRHPPGPDAVELVLDQLFTVCKKTSVAVDIKNALSVFDAIITTSGVPDASFIPLLEVLCSIHASVKSLAGPTARAVRSLAKSGKQSDMVDALHGFLLDTSERPDRNLNVTRGAVDIFRDLLVAYGQPGMPTISFGDLVTSLKHASLRQDGRIDTDILEVCLNMLQGEYVAVTLHNNWSEFVDVMLSCSKLTIDAPPLSPTSTNNSGSTPSTSHKNSTIDDVRSNITANLTRIATSLENLWTRLDRNQKLYAFQLLAEIHTSLSASQSALILRLLESEQLCHPASEDWITYALKVTNDFILARDKSPETRLFALSIFKNAYSSDNAPEFFIKEGLVRSLIDNLVFEDSYPFLVELVSFLVDVAADCDEETLDLVVDTLSSSIGFDGPKEENLPPPSPASSNSPIPTRNLAPDTGLPSLSYVTTSGLVQIFVTALERSSSITNKVYGYLVDIALSPQRPPDGRLAALKILFRLRCDSSGVVYLVSRIETGSLGSTLFRPTEAHSKPGGSEESSTERTRHEDASATPSSRMSQRDSSSTQMTRASRVSRSIAPIWMYDEPNIFPENEPFKTSKKVYAFRGDSCGGDSADQPGSIFLKVNIWVELIITLLQREKDWDVYSYVLVHISPQLVNRDFFHCAIPQVQLLRSVLCDQIKNANFSEPPGWTGAKKKDVILYILEALTMLISLHRYFAKGEQDEIVRAFMLGIGSWEGTSRGCIHALSVCCHEIPLSVTKCLNAVLVKISKIITRSHIAVHILEFLALLARLPEVYVNLRDEEIRTIFGICIRYIETSREQRHKLGDSQNNRSASLPVRLSGGAKDFATAVTEPLGSQSTDDLSRYVYHLTYHVMVFWFLALKLQDRANHVGWITKRLVFSDEHGKEIIEEQSQVFIDMMQRVAFSDLGDTVAFETFPPSPSDGVVARRSWIVGMSIITVETACATGLNQITKRQASGTTYSIYQQRTAPILPHHAPYSHEAHFRSDDPSLRTAVLPPHALLQMTSSAFPVPVAMQPLPLPDDDITRRALSTFDKNDIVDGHKIGVIYIGDGQTSESDILANTSGSQDYEYFLSGLGTKVSLENPKFNPQGLHFKRDGEFTYAWRDRVSEIIYHIPTIMPTNLEADPHCVNKKQHIGNDFVNIIFNRSNTEFNFNTISTQFNFVNIVISPTSRLAFDEQTEEEESVEAAAAADVVGSSTELKDPTLTLEKFNRTYYLVRVLSKPGIPEMSAAAVPKVISGKNLASFVRLIALNASVFSLVSCRGEEHVSSWQNRLREIRRLRDRAFAASVSIDSIADSLAASSAVSTPTGGGSTGTTASSASTPTSAPSASNSDLPFNTARRNTKPSLPGAEESSGHQGSRNFGNERSLSIDNNVFQNLDFSRWSR